MFLRNTNAKIDVSEMYQVRKIEREWWIVTKEERWLDMHILQVQQLQDEDWVLQVQTEKEDLELFLLQSVFVWTLFHWKWIITDWAV